MPPFVAGAPQGRRDRVHLPIEDVITDLMSARGLLGHALTVMREGIEPILTDMRKTLAVALVATCVTLAACGGDRVTGSSDVRSLASCAPGTAILTVPPIALTDVGGWVPLGAMNPPGHTFPTDHQYLYLSTFTTPLAQRPVDLVAPGNVTITRARQTTYSSDGHTDYSLSFSVCREVAGEFGHVGTIAASLLPRLGAFDQGCDRYSPNPGLSVSTCYTRQITVVVRAGEALGTVGGAPNPASLDFSFWDTRVASLAYANPARWIANSEGFDNFHVVPGSDYFAEPARSAIAAKLGSFDGRFRRTVAPLGGTIELDKPGTVQGAWLNPSQPTHPETPHLAIVPDNIDPSVIDVSMGMSQPGFNAGVYRFVPSASGPVNRHPARVTPDGQTYCYELQYGGVLLVRLVDATTLRVEGRPSATSCASQEPWVFNAGVSFDYRR